MRCCCRSRRSRFCGRIVSCCCLNWLLLGEEERERDRTGRGREGSAAVGAEEYAEGRTTHRRDAREVCVEGRVPRRRQCTAIATARSSLLHERCECCIVRRQHRKAQPSITLKEVSKGLLLCGSSSVSPTGPSATCAEERAEGALLRVAEEVRVAREAARCAHGVPRRRERDLREPVCAGRGGQRPPRVCCVRAEQQRRHRAPSRMRPGRAVHKRHHHTRVQVRHNAWNSSLSLLLSLGIRCC